MLRMDKSRFPGERNKKNTKLAFLKEMYNCGFIFNVIKIADNTRMNNDKEIHNPCT